MELLLNLLWLTLALPGVWMWRRESGAHWQGRRFNRVRPFLLFACVLLLLFPVVSATDDLHALRQEVEESGPSKRLVKPVSGDKSPVRLSRASAIPAVIVAILFGLTDQTYGRIWVPPLLLRETASIHERSSRAPPYSSSGKCFGFVA